MRKGRNKTMDKNMERQQNDGTVEIDLLQIARVILAKIWIVIIAAVAMGIIAFTATELLITPMYQSTSKLYVISRQNDSTTTITDIQSSNLLIKDYQVLVTSIPVVEQVIKEQNLDMSVDQLIGEISCTVETESRVLAITVTDADPERAKKIVDSIAAVSSKQIAAVMKIEEVNVIESGRIAAAPSSPDVKKNIILGVAVGMLLSIIVIVVRYMLDDTIKNVDDVERYLGMSTLSLIPMTKEEYNGKPGKNSKRNTRKKRG